MVTWRACRFASAVIQGDGRLTNGLGFGRAAVLHFYDGTYQSKICITIRLFIHSYQ
jgi:hypothetical protein